MKKNKKNAQGTHVQTGTAVKKGLPVKNTMTDNSKNTAAKTPGLNQAKTTRDDLLPSDGDESSI